MTWNQEQYKEAIERAKSGNATDYDCEKLRYAANGCGQFARDCRKALEEDRKSPSRSFW